MRTYFPDLAPNMGRGNTQNWRDNFSVYINCMKQIIGKKLYREEEVEVLFSCYYEPDMLNNRTV